MKKLENSTLNYNNLSSLNNSLSHSLTTKNNNNNNINNNNNKEENDDDNKSVNSMTSEEWELCIEYIPYELQLQYAPVVATFSFITRVNLYKILQSLNYTEEYCAIVLDVIRHIQSNNVDGFTRNGIELHVTRRPVYFYLCRSLNNPQLTEFLTNTSIDLVKKFVELAYYIDQTEVNTMVNLIHDLSIKEFNSLINHSNEPFAKHCRLCRAKRNYLLEFRLIHGQVSEEHCMLPGIIPLYEKAEIWQADNDLRFFTFNYERNLVLWRKEIVDLVKICDKCLIEVHAASSEVNRHEPFHHEIGMVKKHHIEEMREEETKRSILLGQIAIERVRRRVKEWSIRALKCQREGYIKEEKERKMLAKQKEQHEHKQYSIIKHNEMIKKSLSTDKHWLQHDKKLQHIQNEYKLDLVNLNTFPAYSRENPMKPIREHPHSWRLTPYDGDVPIEKDAVSKRFGTGDIQPDIRTTELTMWKNQVKFLHKNYLEMCELKEREEAEKRKNEAIEFNKYIQDRFYQFGRLARQKQNELEQLEEDRLMRRKEEKEKRKLEKERYTESRNRVAMCSEDRRSFRLRYFNQEQEEIQRELELMRIEEEKQTRIDRFWGIPTAIRNAKNNLMKEQADWNEAVDEFRKMCMQVRVLRPYSYEIGMYRDKFTGKKIK